MKTLLTPVIACALIGCGEPITGNHSKGSSYDQCLRVQLFQQCMASLPAGPVATQYNDWDEVVGKCDSVSMYQSHRPIVSIKPECRAY